MSYWNYFMDLIAHQTVVLQDFYMRFFSKENMRRHNPSGGNAMFHSLYDTSLTLGGYAYKVVMILVLYACVITVLMHIAKFVLSTNPQATNEAKGKITRVFIIALCSGIVLGAAAIIVKAFAV